MGRCGVIEGVHLSDAKRFQGTIKRAEDKGVEVSTTKNRSVVVNHSVCQVDGLCHTSHLPILSNSGVSAQPAATVEALAMLNC